MGRMKFACDVVRSGRIGKVLEVHVGCGGPSAPCPLPGQPVPKHLDWDLWLGPAPWRPYHPQIHPVAFRAWSDYSGGGMTDWGAHHFDLAQWALGKDDTGPVEIVPPDGTRHRHLTYKYADGVSVIHTSLDIGQGVTVIGTEGKVWMAALSMPALLCRSASAAEPAAVKSKGETITVAVVTGGHAYDVFNFHRLFRSLSGVEAIIQHMDDFASSPLEVRESYNAVLFYIMLMQGPTNEGQPWYAGRPKDALEHLGSTPQGIFVLHHALLAYPQWPVWSELVGIADDRNKEFREDLLGWSKICRRIYIWDYVVNFSYPLTPHPNLRVLGPNIRFLVDHGVKGYFAEALPQSPGLEMAELRNWVLAKLMWNPKLDGNALVEEFVNGYYGPAGKHVLAYINLMHDAVEKSGDYLGLGSPPDAASLQWGRGFSAAESAATSVSVFIC